MTRTFALVVLAALSGTTFAGTPPFGDRELSLAGVALGSSEKSVIAQLGNPQQRSATGEGEELQYPGLKVLVGWQSNKAPGIQRHVLQLTATSPSACTPSGICPGMPLKRAVAVYGEPVLVLRQSGDFFEYYSHESSCWLQLAVWNGTIESIAAVCEP